MNLRKTSATRLGLGGIALVAALTLTSCASGDAPSEAPSDAATAGGEPQQGGKIVAALAGDPQVLDHGLNSGSLSISVGTNIFEPLFALGETYDVHPMLVDDYEYSDDLLTLTLTLRDGVTFHDGSALDSGDVKASLERWMQVSNSGKVHALTIASIDTPDDLTVVINLSAPNYALVGSLAGSVQQAIILPQEIAEAAGTNPLTNEQLIGTGPYEFESYAPGQNVLLTRYEDYSARSEDWGGAAGNKAAYADEIEYVFVTDDAQRLNGLTTGQWQWVQAIAADSAESASADPNLNVVSSSTHLMPTLLLNQTETGAFHDLEARQALNMALDKEAIATATMGPDWLWAMTPGMVPELNAPMYSTAGDEVFAQHEPEKAAKLFADAGVTSVRILSTQTYSQFYQTAVLIQATLQELGIEATIDVFDFPTMVQKLATDPTAWDISMTRFSGLVTSPTDVLYLAQPAAWGGYSSDEMQALLAKYQASTNADEAKATVDEIQQLLYEDLPVIILGDQGTFGVSSVKLHLKDSWTGVLWNAWLEQ